MDKSETSLDAYFASKALLPPSDLLSITQALTSIQTHSVSKLKHPLKSRKVSLQSLNSPITSLAAKHQLVLARRQEKELKDRLVYISCQIEELNRHPSAPRHRSYSSRNHSDSTRPTANTSKLGERSESRIVLLRKLKREQTERQRKVQSSLEEYRDKVETEDREMRRREEERKRKQRETIVQELKKRHEAESCRKQELKRIKTEADRKLRDIKAAKPLYEALEDQYNTSVRLPESLRQQALLARKKPHISLQDIMRHSREVEGREEAEVARRREKRAQKQAEMQKLAKDLHFYRPKAADIIEAEEETRRRQAVEKADKVRRLQARKQHYGKIIRELINTQPKSLTPKPLLRPSRSVLSTRSIPKPHSSDYRPSLVPRRTRKSHSTHSLPDPPTLPKPRNYLTEFRLHRESSAASRLEQVDSKWRDLLDSSDSPTRLEKVHKEALRMETVARSQELRLREIENWEEAVNTQEAVSSLYVDAIKAKIALLTAL